MKDKKSQSGKNQKEMYNTHDFDQACSVIFYYIVIHLANGMNFLLI